MQAEARRELEILTTIAEGVPVTQRALARRLDIALGLANLYVKRLARKGYIKITTIPPHRIRYLLTPQGVAQKSRLTYEYMAYSLRIYGQARRNLRDALVPLVQNGVKRVALYGTGEAAELAYLTLRELGAGPAAVFDTAAGRTFLGMPVRNLDERAAQEYDCIVLATFEDASGLVDRLTALRVPLEVIVTLGGPARRPSGVAEQRRDEPSPKSGGLEPGAG